MRTILISGMGEIFQNILSKKLEQLQLHPHELIDIKYSTTSLIDNVNVYVIHSALIIYNRPYEPTTATAAAAAADNH